MPTVVVGGGGGDQAELYYEAHGSGEKKVVMVMGFAATCQLFLPLVRDMLSRDEGYSFLIFDNRASGRSSGTVERHTTTLLAQDALCLCEHVFGVETADAESGAPQIQLPPIHVHGVSMGGMIAQELAALLLEKERLASLFLSVTALKRYSVRVAVPAGLYWCLFSPMMLISKEKMVEQSLKMGYSEAILESTNEEGRPMREVLREQLLEEWDETMSFSLKTIASQSGAAGTHYFGPEKVRRLVESGVPVMCHIANGDTIMPTALQEEAAAALHAKVVRTEGGHMSGRLQRPQIIAAWSELIQEGCTANKEASSSA
eukprot:TRINITY_DN18173_c0_g1_i1.p1 TRINITY_DN18173_c0_g1~~TRINITY_DN18173_c0_g1_i1.p1  ORF type:complete len:316 (-),score=69.53 TRINITY_DN18173_c0_g1_i1:13-960(-)